MGTTFRSIDPVKMLRLTLAVCALVALTSALRVERNDLWESFKLRHNRVYAGQRDVIRREIWESNLDYIERHNVEEARGLHTFTMGENQFTDLTNDEFRQMMNGYVMSNRSSSVQFVATGSLEGQHFKKAGQLVSLSEQNLVDCSKKEGNKGCKGGLMDKGFEYIIKNNGIDTEKSYPYRAKTGTMCQFKEADVGATMKSFVDVKRGSEEALAQALSEIGPISVAMDAGHMSFQHYKRGIYKERQCSSVRLDHGVLAVGYGSEADGDFWIVKNSWGTVWGDEGYFKLARNDKNMCGLATQASYPVV